MCFNQNGGVRWIMSDFENSLHARAELIRRLAPGTPFEEDDTQQAGQKCGNGSCHEETFSPIAAWCASIQLECYGSLRPSRERGARDGVCF